jgi:hypothetical protein
MDTIQAKLGDSSLLFVHRRKTLLDFSTPTCNKEPYLLKRIVPAAKFVIFFKY